MLNNHIKPYISSNGGGLFTLNTNDPANRRYYLKNGFEEFDEKYLSIENVELGCWSYKMNLPSKNNVNTNIS